MEITDPVTTMVASYQIDPIAVLNEIMRANNRFSELLTKLDMNNEAHKAIVLKNNALIMLLYDRLKEIVR